MPVSTTHPEYDLRVNSWVRCRDAFEGQDAIKAAGTMYLPRLSEQSTAEYEAYKTRALFYSITSKTISALVGMATSKAPILKFQPEMKSYFTDDSGVQFHEILSGALSENLLMGRYGILIDRPKGGGNPTLAGYTTENILNWRVDDHGNPTMVVLRENISVQDPLDEYVQTVETQYRVLRLKSGTYIQELYDEDENLLDSITPLNTGLSMNYIPFFIVNPFGLGFAMHKPPTLDIVDINISHYRTSADLEHGRHYTGLPVPVVSGVDANTKLKIGSMIAWVLPDVNARASYLEFTGQGLISLEKALAEKQSQLASLSARLLGQSGNGSEAAETVRLRYMSETASLAAIVRSTEALLNRVYQAVCEMQSLDKTQISVELSKEFLDSKLSGQDLRELVGAFIDGAISEETLVYNLRRGDLIFSAEIRLCGVEADRRFEERKV